MRRVLLSIAFAIAVTAIALAAAPPSNQVVTYSVLAANQTGNFTWATSAPTGSAYAVTYARYKTLVTNVTTSACPIATATGGLTMTWGNVLACSSSHTASQQSESVSGSYSTIYYTSTYDSFHGIYKCFGPYGSDSYVGTPITLPAGTVAPTSSATQLSLTLSSITRPGTTTSITVQLKNPSGVVVNTWSFISTASWGPQTYSAAGAPAGAWSWVISDNGGSEGTCDASTGASGGKTQSSWSGTASWYQ